MPPFGLENSLSPAPGPSPLQPDQSPMQLRQQAPGQNINQLAEAPVALPAGFDRTTQTVKQIESELGKKGTLELDDHVRDEIFQSLNGLRTKDPEFAKDLIMINARLQHDGFLPNLFITDNQPGRPVDANKQIGPNSKDGFHLDETIAPPAPTGGQIYTAPPEH